MSASIKKRDFLIVAVIAISIEGILIWMASQEHASHAPTLLLLFHLPGIVLAELMRIPGRGVFIVCGVTGAIQLFIIFLVALIFWKQIYGRRDA